MARIKKASGIKKNSEQDETDFQRIAENKNKIQDIIIACEDKVSAPTYFKMIVSKLIQNRAITQDSFVIATPHNTHPTGVLADLVNHQCDNGKTYQEFEHKWIVIDRDKERVNGGGHTKEDFNNAIKDAEKLEVDVAYAIDSFEIWYLLHFDYRDTAISRDDILDTIIKKLKAINLSKFDKLNKKNIKNKENTKLIFVELLGMQETAIKNAERLLESSPENNDPSTTVHKLVELLNGLDKNTEQTTIK